MGVPASPWTVRAAAHCRQRKSFSGHEPEPSSLRFARWARSHGTMLQNVAGSEWSQSESVVRLRLISVQVSGYRRLAEAKVNLASKIIAVVGPNEAGKTSLLEVLARLDSSEAVPALDSLGAAT